MPASVRSALMASKIARSCCAVFPAGGPMATLVGGGTPHVTGNAAASLGWPPSSPRISIAIRPFWPPQLTGTRKSLPGFDSGCWSFPCGSLIRIFGFVCAPTSLPLSVACAFGSSVRGNGSMSTCGSCMASTTFVPPAEPRAVAMPYRTCPEIKCPQRPGRRRRRRSDHRSADRRHRRRTRARRPSRCHREARRYVRDDPCRNPEAPRPAGGPSARGSGSLLGQLELDAEGEVDLDGLATDQIRLVSLLLQR